MDNQALERLKEQGQDFFEPYYSEVIKFHPGGIAATDVKAIVREQIEEKFGFDPFDKDLLGVNSTGAAKSSQWANNLVSNEVLVGKVLVLRPSGSRVVFFPLAPEENSVPSEDSHDWDAVDEEFLALADSRIPAVAPESSGATKYLRSPALAEWIRRKSGYKCLVSAEYCVKFLGKGGNPYIEIHHIIPMAVQKDTEFNLDQSCNMVALCLGCHAKLHKGNAMEAGLVPDSMLENYSVVSGADFSERLASSGVSCVKEDILSYYGL
jgi:HNH endonuclease